MRKIIISAKIIRSIVIITGMLLSSVVNVAAETNGERTDPIEFVAPELRAALMRNIEMYQGKPMAITAEMLPHIRARMAEATEKQAMSLSYAVKKLVIPGPTGAPNVHVYLIGADKDKSRPVILYFHGGGYILGSANSDLPRLQQLAKKHDCVIVSVEYRLAPETPFPGALEDSYAALKWIYDNAKSLNIDKNRIAVMGESAGGGHAAMLSIAARDRGEFLLVGQILVFPMLDDRTGSTREMPYWMGYGSWNAGVNRFGWSSLLGVPAGSKNVPEGSVPARQKNLAGLPPTFIGVGSIDLFAEEDIEYARRLVHAGVPTELLVVPGAFHGFNFSAPEADASEKLNAAIDSAIRQVFSLTPH